MPYTYKVYHHNYILSNFKQQIQDDLPQMRQNRTLRSPVFCKPQGFPPGQQQKRPPQPIRTIQGNEYTDHMEMANEEVQGRIEYEKSAEYQPYADDSGPCNHIFFILYLTIFHFRKKE